MRKPEPTLQKLPPPAKRFIDNPVLERFGGEFFGTVVNVVKQWTGARRDKASLVFAIDWRFTLETRNQRILTQAWGDDPTRWIGRRVRMFFVVQVDHSGAPMLKVNGDPLPLEKRLEPLPEGDPRPDTADPASDDITFDPTELDR